MSNKNEVSEMLDKIEAWTTKLSESLAVLISSINAVDDAVNNLRDVMKEGNDLNGKK